MTSREASGPSVDGPDAAPGNAPDGPVLEPRVTGITAPDLVAADLYATGRRQARSAPRHHTEV
jgi:hypothetical protein